jgi:hypothetical protein
VRQPIKVFLCKESETPHKPAWLLTWRCQCQELVSAFTPPDTRCISASSSPAVISSGDLAVCRSSPYHSSRVRQADAFAAAGARESSRTASSALYTSTFRGIAPSGGLPVVASDCVLMGCFGFAARLLSCFDTGPPMNEADCEVTHCEVAARALAVVAVCLAQACAGATWLPTVGR